MDGNITLTFNNLTASAAQALLAAAGGAVSVSVVPAGANPNPQPQYAQPAAPTNYAPPQGNGPSPGAGAPVAYNPPGQYAPAASPGGGAMPPTGNPAQATGAVPSVADVNAKVSAFAKVHGLPAVKQVFGELGITAMPSATPEQLVAAYHRFSAI
jgi:hypothetical protein